MEGVRVVNHSSAYTVLGQWVDRPPATGGGGTAHDETWIPRSEWHSIMPRSAISMIRPTPTSSWLMRASRSSGRSAGASSISSGATTSAPLYEGGWVRKDWPVSFDRSTSLRHEELHVDLYPPRATAMTGTSGESMRLCTMMPHAATSLTRHGGIHASVDTRLLRLPVAAIRRAVRQHYLQSNVMNDDRRGGAQRRRRSASPARGRRKKARSPPRSRSASPKKKGRARSKPKARAKPKSPARKPPKKKKESPVRRPTGQKGKARCEDRADHVTPATRYVKDKKSRRRKRTYVCPHGYELGPGNCCVATLRTFLDDSEPPQLIPASTSASGAAIPSPSAPAAVPPTVKAKTRTSVAAHPGAPRKQADRIADQIALTPAELKFLRNASADVLAAIANDPAALSRLVDASNALDQSAVSAAAATRKKGWKTRLRNIGALAVGAVVHVGRWVWSGLKWVWDHPQISLLVSIGLLFLKRWICEWKYGTPQPVKVDLAPGWSQYITTGIITAIGWSLDLNPAGLIARLNIEFARHGMGFMGRVIAPLLVAKISTGLLSLSAKYAQRAGIILTLAQAIREACGQQIEWVRTDTPAADVVPGKYKDEFERDVAVDVQKGMAFKDAVAANFAKYNPQVPKYFVTTPPVVPGTSSSDIIMMGPNPLGILPPAAATAAAATAAVTLPGALPTSSSSSPSTLPPLTSLPTGTPGAPKAPLPLYTTAVDPRTGDVVGVVAEPTPAEIAFIWANYNPHLSDHQEGTRDVGALNDAATTVYAKLASLYDATARSRGIQPGYAGPIEAPSAYRNYIDDIYTRLQGVPFLLRTDRERELMGLIERNLLWTRPVPQLTWRHVFDTVVPGVISVPSLYPSEAAPPPATWCWSATGQCGPSAVPLPPLPASSIAPSGALPLPTPQQ